MGCILRLEEGRGDERWFKSCSDLVRSRLYMDEMKDHNIREIVVHRVVRIHNRFLRNSYEEYIDQNFQDKYSKDGLEYLFYPQNLDNDQELIEVMNKGFKNKTGESFPYTALYNTVLGADLPRIQEKKK